jgi:TM2 domain-containing membrane protein YozV
LSQLLECDKPIKAIDKITGWAYISTGNYRIILSPDANHQQEVYMYCRNCGKEIAQQAIVCPSCGCAPTTGRVFCQNCAQPTDPNAQVCVKCGVQLRGVGEKSKIVAGILGIVVGGLGVHRFYLGYIGMGIAQIAVTLVTFGFGHLWGLIEGILILTGTYLQKDAKGRPLREG